MRRESGTTLKDIARIAQVHPATVSRALDPKRAHLVTEDTRIRIQDIAGQFGYQVNAVARSLRKGASSMIGVVVADVANPFLPPVLRGIEQEVRSENLMLLIAETHGDSRTLADVLEHFASQQVSAVIVAAARTTDYDIIRRAAQSMVVVLAVRKLPSGNFPSVVPDDFLGGQLAARHLVELGHHDLAQLHGPGCVSSFMDRSAGFESVMSKTTARDVSEGARATAATVEEGHRLATMLLQRKQDRPTGLFAHNDLMAIGAIQAIREQGLRCPEDVSVVGYNDAPLSNYVDPPLTTVRLPGLEVGRTAARVAMAQLRGQGDEVMPELLSPKLVVRSSSTHMPAPAPVGAGEA